jgi:hypothetical protein
VQENVRQRLQHHCQEIFNKISFQEIFSVAGNILQDIFVILYTGMPYNFTPCLQKRFASRDFPPQWTIPQLTKMLNSTSLDKNFITA